MNKREKKLSDTIVVLLRLLDERDHEIMVLEAEALKVRETLSLACRTLPMARTFNENLIGE